MDTSDVPVPNRTKKPTGGYEGVYARSCANAGEAEDEAAEETINSGTTVTLLNLDLSAWPSSELKNLPVSDQEQLANWRAGCGRSARPVRREGREQSRSYPLSLLIRWVTKVDRASPLDDGRLAV